MGSSYYKLVFPPYLSIVYIEVQTLGTHFNTFIKYSLINYFEFFLLNKNLLSKLLYEKEKFKKRAMKLYFICALKCVSSNERKVKKNEKDKGINNYCYKCCEISLIS